MKFTGNIIDVAKNYALKKHSDVNHTYDGKPYKVHLEMVYRVAIHFRGLLASDTLDEVIASAWTHDLIEDCRVTYNDIKEVLGKNIADITYALTNDKGKTRKERAGDKYYKGIRDVYGARYIKICDRIANASYSKRTGSSMFKKYQEEQDYFKDQLWNPIYSDMFDKLDEILEL